MRVAGLAGIDLAPGMLEEVVLEMLDLPAVWLLFGMEGWKDRRIHCRIEYTVEFTVEQSTLYLLHCCTNNSVFLFHLLMYKYRLYTLMFICMCVYTGTTLRFTGLVTADSRQ